MSTSNQNRLTAILKQKLDASEIQFVMAGEEPEDDAHILCWDLGRGRQLVVTFAVPPADRDEKRKTLAALVDSFAELFAEVTVESPRPRLDPAEGLKVELSALAGRTGAVVALVIDAASPIVWGASEAPTTAAAADAKLTESFSKLSATGLSWLELLARKGSLSSIAPLAPSAPSERREPEEGNVRVLRLVPPVDDLAGLSAEARLDIEPRLSLARAAITRIRKSPQLAELHRGEHFHEAVREENIGYLARSFATIYVLVLVFPSVFDELGAERAVVRSLPTIERLVVALPPDDSPTHQKGAVVALRRRRR